MQAPPLQYPLCDGLSMQGTLCYAAQFADPVFLRPTTPPTRIQPRRPGRKITSRNATESCHELACHLVQLRAYTKAWLQDREVQLCKRSEGFDVDAADPARLLLLVGV